MYAAGLMSGTSCDGMSGALIRLPSPGYRPSLAATAHVPYLRSERGLLLSLASGDPAAPAAVARAGGIVARASVACVRRLLRAARLPARRLAVIGAHGHTLYHGPHDRAGAVTFQCGNLSRIAEETGVAVVGDFRARDVAAGGEGAPLAPWAHRLLFASPREPGIVLNLGGIANVTWLPAGARDRDVIAFDTGPANMVIDLLAARATRGRLDCDRGGKLAARGRIVPRVLLRLLAHPYLRRRPPKSTGREEFGAALLPAFRGLSGPDAVATATAFTARSVADQIGRWLPPAARRAPVWVGGGGARNPARKRALAGALAPRPVRPVALLGWPDQALEPVCFALLAVARLRGIPNVLPRVTGARRAVCAGVLVPAR
jgi:anhydro-N-acetylmuramic acid kinase